MSIDKDKLKALAEAASQGHWDQDGFEVHNDDVEDYRVAQCRFMPDAAFIAAASPASILELLAENEALRKDAERLDLIESLARSSYTGLSFAKGEAKGSLEALWFHKRTGAKPSLREAIDAAQKEVGGAV
ncbi:ead/Ea22-like family protein [Pseudomonas asiatica]|uniref:ead/Ea22-like family protein n=1 Tax=Pseudomonas asiatica TaxID=2219225 RepID=UPI003C6E6730